MIEIYHRTKHVKNSAAKNEKGPPLSASHAFSEDRRRKLNLDIHTDETRVGLLLQKLAKLEPCLVELRLRRADRASEDACDLFVLTAFYIDQWQGGRLIPFGSTGVRKKASASPLIATDSFHQKKQEIFLDTSFKVLYLSCKT